MKILSKLAVWFKEIRMAREVKRIIKPDKPAGRKGTL